MRIFLTRTVGKHASTVEIDKDDIVQSGDTIQVQMELDELRGTEQTTAVK